MNILVTGATGFVGKHLVGLLLDEGHKVVATGHADQSPFSSKVQFAAVDLTDASATAKLPLSDIEAVIHLAGLAAVGPSYNEPARYLNFNTAMQINIYERFKELGRYPRMVIISSGSVYKNPIGSRDLPLTEQSAVLPPSPYAVSKLSQELLATYYNQLGLETVIARPFNHFGPGQEPGFISADLAKQVIEAKQANKKEIKVGNLATARDYTDVRDIVRAYYLLLQKGQAGETYNICSGQAVSGQELLSALVKASGTDIKTIKDRSLFRPSDAPVIYGSYQKLAQTTGWQPTIPFEKTVRDIFEDWQTRLAG